MKQKGRLLIGLGIVGFIVVFLRYDLHRYLTLEFIKSQQASLQQLYETHPAATIASYLLIYVATTALSLPGATVLTLLGGGLFGLVMGTVLVSFASTLGATLAFLVSRFFFQDVVQRRFSDRARQINEGIRRDGGFYLFTLRLVPIFPFFIVNLAMGVTPITVKTFYLVSQIGMLPATILYVNAGTELAQIDSLKGILSPPLLLSFAALGFFPLVAKWVLSFFRRTADLR